MTYFIPSSSVFIVNFEYAIAGWVYCYFTLPTQISKFFIRKSKIIFHISLYLSTQEKKTIYGIQINIHPEIGSNFLTKLIFVDKKFLQKKFEKVTLFWGVETVGYFMKVASNVFNVWVTKTLTLNILSTLIVISHS